MNWLSPTTVKVKALKLPGDIAQRQKHPHVAELAESIRERTGGRPIHLPTVEYPSMQLIAGRDRIAAAMLNGKKSVEVQMVSQVTEAERRDIERDENIHRRVDDRDELIRQRVQERTLEIEAKRAEGPATEPRPAHRPKTPKGEAREQVALELGTTPEAVRVAEARAVAAELPDESSETLPCPVETYGLPLVTDAEAERLRTVRAAIDQADALLKRAQGVLSPLEGVMPGFFDVGALTSRIHGVAVHVRMAKPLAACPYCKRIPSLMTKCKGCERSGFVGSDSLLAVADELKLGGAQAMVTVDGKLVPYAKAAAKPAPTAKKIKIVDEHGDDLPPWETP